MTSITLEEIKDGFEQVAQSVDASAADAPDDSTTWKHRKLLDRWLSTVVEGFSQSSPEARTQIREFFSDEQRGWLIFEYIDRVLSRCVPRNACECLRKALIALSIQNREGDIREFDLRLERISLLAGKMCQSRSSIFDEVIQMADARRRSSRTWSARESMIHWQKEIK